MKQPSDALEFFLKLSKIQTVMTRKFDGYVGNLTEFRILLTLSQASGKKMRRIDLADSIGLTASGVTRLLLPMEKIGLVSREIHPTDARASFVLLAPGGARELTEKLERAELFADDIFELLGWKDAEVILLEKLSSLVKIFS